MKIGKDKIGLRIYPDPILKKMSVEVEKFLEIPNNLIQSMIDIMEYNNGIGIAAPQVGVSKRVFLMKTPNMPKIKVFINPKIWLFSGIQESIEGCLSLPSIEVKKMRPQKIEIDFLNENGNKQSEVFEGLEAACVSHEIDHLNGRLIIDV